jgi:hypothetical protein
MTAPLVNPVTVNIGQTFHLTFVDQNGNPLPTGTDAPDFAEITANIFGINPRLPDGTATWVIDADKRGATITGVAFGSGFVQANVKKGTTTVSSAQFQIIVPWTVTALGTVTP